MKSYLLFWTPPEPVNFIYLIGKYSKIVTIYTELYNQLGAIPAENPVFERISKTAFSRFFATRSICS